VPAVAIGQIVQGDDRLPLLTAGQVGLRDHLAETGVPLGVTGQHHQVGAVGVGHAGPGMGDAGPTDGELGPEDGGQPEGRAASAKRTTP